MKKIFPKFPTKISLKIFLTIFTISLISPAISSAQSQPDCLACDSTPPTLQQSIEFLQSAIAIFAPGNLQPSIDEQQRSDRLGLFQAGVLSLGDAPRTIGSDLPQRTREQGSTAAEVFANQIGELASTNALAGIKILLASRAVQRDRIRLHTIESQLRDHAFAMGQQGTRRDELSPTQREILQNLSTELPDNFLRFVPSAGRNRAVFADFQRTISLLKRKVLFGEPENFDPGTRKKILLSDETIDTIIEETACARRATSCAGAFREFAKNVASGAQNFVADLKSGNETFKLAIDDFRNEVIAPYKNKTSPFSSRENFKNFAKNLVDVSDTLDIFQQFRDAGEDAVGYLTEIDFSPVSKPVKFTPKSDQAVSTPTLQNAGTLQSRRSGRLEQADLRLQSRDAIAAEARPSELTTFFPVLLAHAQQILIAIGDKDQPDSFVATRGEICELQCSNAGSRRCYPR